MTAPDLRYTDRDVRENPLLVPLVEQYLTQYEGEFAFLRDAKIRSAAGLPLGVGMVRGVLNCMRNDTRILFELPTPRFSIELPKTERRLRVVPDDPEKPYRPFRVDCRIRVKFDYWYTTNRMAKWFHLIDHERSQASWLRHPNEIRWEIRALCGKELSPTREYHLTSDYAELPTHQHLCSGCAGDVS